MFSRYRKPDEPSATPVAPVPDPLPAAHPAVPAPADKDRKRRDKLAEIKVQLHKELLDNLNLAALDKAS